LTDTGIRELEMLTLLSRHNRRFGHVKLRKPRGSSVQSLRQFVLRW